MEIHKFQYYTDNICKVESRSDDKTNNKKKEEKERR
jgi:hypothetical protein